MRRRDLREIMAVEAEVFPEPWSHAIFTSELALRHGRWYRVARSGRHLAGYAGMMLVDHEAHVTTIATALAWQGRGVATTLLAAGIRHAVAEGVHQVSLEVAAHNDRAQALYRRFGFMPVGVRKGYYPVTGEDALVMWAYEVDSAVYAERLEELEEQLRSRP